VGRGECAFKMQQKIWDFPSKIVLEFFFFWKILDFFENFWFFLENLVFFGNFGIFWKIWYFLENLVFFAKVGIFWIVVWVTPSPF
jgi:hypothetical protein